jgi:hypothetical protein
VEVVQRRAQSGRCKVVVLEQLELLPAHGVGDDVARPQRDSVDGGLRSGCVESDLGCEVRGGLRFGYFAVGELSLDNCARSPNALPLSGC